MRRRRLHLRRPLRIIGQQEQPFARLVEPPDRRHPGQRGIQKRVNGLPAFFVGRSGYGSTRLVEHEINPGGGGQRLTVHFHSIALQADSRLRIATDCAIETHPPRPDEIRSLGARAVAKLRKGARQSHVPGMFRASHAPMLTEHA